MALLAKKASLGYLVAGPTTSIPEATYGVEPHLDKSDQGPASISPRYVSRLFGRR